jgi:rSAM/selenodomain-associated transferase 2
MKHQPSIAIITPVFEEEQSIKGFVQTLKALPYDELYIVDGGSADNTWQVLQALDVRCIQSPKGRANQMNAGAKHCKSDVLLFVHADTLMSPTHITDIKKQMLNQAVVGGRFDVQLSGKHMMFKVIAWMMNIRSCVTGISTGDQCQFVRRSVFEDMGGFPNQPLMEDVAFSKRLKRYGKVVCLKNKVVTSSRRWEQHGIFNTVFLMWKIRLFYFLGVKPEVLAKMYHHG